MMIEMIQKKQWDRLGRNVAIIVLIMLLVSGCGKTVIDVKEADRATPDPGLMVKPKGARPMAGKVKLPKHLRQQARREKRTGAIEDQLDSLQGFVRDNQKPTPQE